jgi:hypothetical protein
MARKGASFAVLVTVLVFSLPAFAASPPKAGCRPVSKLEYTIKNSSTLEPRCHAATSTSTIFWMALSARW